MNIANITVMRASSLPAAATLSTAALGRRPSRWPFPPAPPDRQTPVPATPAVRRAPCRLFGHRQAVSSCNIVGMRRMLGDVVLAGLWGGMIPGLMWLGVAVGF